MKNQSLDLLCRLISTPSVSREEHQTANILEAFLNEHGFKVNRKGNNVWADNQKRGPFSVLLNSHHDTVAPSGSWDSDPFEPKKVDGKIYGLGSNDAGASVVAMTQSFIDMSETVPYRLVLALSAEEEISGSQGVVSILKEIGHIDLAIVGEPTQMHMALAEKGLMVIDGHAEGKAGHAARMEGSNSIYKAIADIERLLNYTFSKKSALLGNVHLSVTQINAGTQHNVTPASCHFVIDVRSTDCYSNQEILETLQKLCSSKLIARSLRLQPSGIALDHPIVLAGESLGLPHFGSPTLSDMALMPFNSIKIGPGHSERSHQANEFIYEDELISSIETYNALLKKLCDYETMG